MSIKSAIEKIKKKERDSKIPQEIKDFIIDFFKELVIKSPEFIKGDKGDNGKNGLNGKDYILTSKDKQEIASKIEIPTVEKVIEKTEVIKEQPIITNKITNYIKEVAKYETAEQIIEKINTLTEKQEISTIKGLGMHLANLKNSIRELGKNKGGGGGGGGLGNIQHETKTVNTSTTSIQTNYPIAGGGYAILGAYYQGQFIVRGEHYTVGADRKTLTLNFTVPNNNTKIDIVYIR